MDKKRTLSIKDIARLSGVSAATVSHVMNKKGRYSKETEEKVNRIISQYGFQTNRAAKSLKSASSNMVGLILPNLKNNFFSAIAVEAEHMFDEQDYSLLICTTENDPEKEIRYFHKLDSLQVDGIMCISAQKMLDSSLLTRDIPVVLIDRTPVNTKQYHIVDSDAEEGIYNVTRLMIQRGHRHIIFISSYLASYVPTSRSHGYVRAMQEKLLPCGPDTIIQLPKGESLEQAEVGVLDYISRGNPVDAIICTSDNQAIGAMTALKRLNLRIPEDVAVVGFDNQIQSSLCTPALSTLARDPHEMAERASDVLLRLIRGEEDVPERITIGTHLIERETTYTPTE